MQNDLEFVKSHVAQRVEAALSEGRAEGSIRDELIGEGFPQELFDIRLRAVAARRRQAVRAWGIGQIVVGAAITVVGVGFSVGTYLMARGGGGGKYFILSGVIILGAATLGRGLEALFFRD